MAPQMKTIIAKVTKAIEQVDEKCPKAKVTLTSLLERLEGSAPKRKPSEYNLYFKKKFAQLKKENPEKDILDYIRSLDGPMPENDVWGDELYDDADLEDPRQRVAYARRVALTRWTEEFDDVRDALASEELPESLKPVVRLRYIEKMLDEDACDYSGASAEGYKFDCVTYRVTDDPPTLFDPQTLFDDDDELLDHIADTYGHKRWVAMKVHSKVCFELGAVPWEASSDVERIWGTLKTRLAEFDDMDESGLEVVVRKAMRVHGQICFELECLSKWDYDSEVEMVWSALKPRLAELDAMDDDEMEGVVMKVVKDVLGHEHDDGNDGNDGDIA